jgi:hypothetical protein
MCSLEESARFPRVPKPWERVISGGNAYFGTSTSLGNASFCSIFTYESSVPTVLGNSLERMRNVTSQCVPKRSKTLETRDIWWERLFRHLGNASFCSIFTYESSVPKKLQNSWERMPNVTSQCVPTHNTAYEIASVSKAFARVPTPV